MNSIIKFLKINKYMLIIYMALIVGFAVRLVFITDFPNALNVDEASSGYDAYSILNCGIDRNGNFLPIYLEAWGSGQSAMYAYLTIPFIKILGLTIIAIRLPMAIIGCISLVVMYKLLKKITDEKTVAIGLIFFAITPWHIMKSRWGMDCNIFPDIMLYATFFIIKFLKEKRPKDLYIASAIIALSSYTYATSFFFLPIFVMLLMIYLILKKEITAKQLIISLLIMFCISLPMVLYVIVNKFQFNTMQLFITIPLLSENRFEEVSNIFQGNFIKTSWTNFKEAILILVKQNDEMGWNALAFYGITYIISLPFMLIGIFLNFKTKEKEKWIFNLWFIAAFLLLFVVEPNINRINIIIIPMIYYTIIGIAEIFQKFALAKIFLPLIYLSLFVSFEISYFTTDWKEYYTFIGGVENVIQYVDEIDRDKIYFEYSFKEPYIYVCFYNKIDAREFTNTVKYKSDKGFDRVKSFGRYYFYIPKALEDNAVYVLKAENVDKYDFNDDKWSKVYIDDFVVIKQ